MRKTSILLALMMALALMLTAPLAAWAAPNLRIAYNGIPASGTGFTWDSASKTMTLTDGYEGDPIVINCDPTATATIIVTGNVEVRGNIATPAAISCDGSLIIQGSGTLTVSGLISDGGHGISAAGDITISGMLGDISGGGSVISAGGNVTISDTVGDISGDYCGIYADSGNVTISGTATVGNISGGGIHGGGIRSDNGSVTISGTVGDISATGSGANRNGIYAYVNVEISGTVGVISSSGYDGSGIYASSGNITISGTVVEISGSGTNGRGIYANVGDVTISGTAIVGDISGSNSGNGISASGAVTISGTAGDISGGSSGSGIHAKAVTISGTVGDISVGDSGIYAYNGNVMISGTVGDISGDGSGIHAKAVTISGTAGDISGDYCGIYASNSSIDISGTVQSISGSLFGIAIDTLSGGGGMARGGAIDSRGIYASRGGIKYVGAAGSCNVTISGAIPGGISGGGVGIIIGGLGVASTGAEGRAVARGGAIDTRGMYASLGGIKYVAATANSGNVIITGQVQSIRGGNGPVDHDINASAYAALEYSGSLLSITKCSPAGYTVTFDYGTLSPSGAPQKAYISNGNKIPSFTVPATSGQIFGGWYQEAALTNSWNFASDTVTADATLYAKWTAAVAPGITTSTLPNGTVGTAYSQTLAASGTAPITWSLDSGSLPGGLHLGADGKITGTPTTAETANFTVKATNAAGSITKALSIKIDSSGGGGGGGGTTPALPSHSFKDGVNTYTQGSGKQLVHTTEKNFSLFSGVKVDGKTLTKNTHYKVENGSTVVTLYDDYLDTLSAGKHTLSISFTDGVTVTADFTVVKAETDKGAATPEKWANPFTDVKTSDWFYGDVEYVYSQGLMNGTGASTFSPNATLTRAMFITILARLAGVDTAGGETWYAKAVEWAVAEGISDGTNPHAPITREQMVVMLYNYMKYKGIAIPSGSADAFADEASISPWALEAVRAIQNMGIVSGRTGNLFDPQATATRAEVATIFARFVEALIK